LRLKADDQLVAEITPEGLLLRPAVTLPIEMYTPEREQEFDAAEAELAAYFSREKSNRKPTAYCADHERGFQRIVNAR